VPCPKIQQANLPAYLHPSIPLTLNVRQGMEKETFGKKVIDLMMKRHESN